MEANVSGFISNYTGTLGHNFVGNWLTLYNVGQFITSSNFIGTKILWVRVSREIPEHLFPMNNDDSTEPPSYS